MKARDPLDFRPAPRAEIAFARKYEQAKAEFTRTHPDATPREYEQFIRELARRLGI